MKTLSVNEMGIIEGGREASMPCTLDLVQLGASVGSLIVGLIGVGSGPIGWAAMASIMGALGWSGLAGAQAIIDCL